MVTALAFVLRHLFFTSLELSLFNLKYSQVDFAPFLGIYTTLYPTYIE